MLLPANTSAAAIAESRDRNRRSPPITTGWESSSARIVSLAMAWQSRRTLASVYPSPITARQPPVPNTILVSVFFFGTNSRLRTMSVATASSSVVLMPGTSSGSWIW